VALYAGREAREESAAPPAGRRTTAGPVAATTMHGEPRARSAILVSFVLLVILGVALFAVALVTQPAREQRAERAAPPVADGGAPAPPVGAITAAPDVPTRPIPAPAANLPPAKAPEPARAAPGPTPAALAPPVPVAPAGSRAWLPQVQSATTGISTPYRLVARVSEPTWIRVRTEDGRTTEETVPAGAMREWVSNRPFVITIGNAGGVSFELNGRSLPSFGASGTVISGLVLPPEGGRPR
jgi:hypothetical protein